MRLRQPVGLRDVARRQQRQAAADTEYDEQTLRIAKHVAGRFKDLFRRRNKLSFAHHQEVASFSPTEARRGTLQGKPGKAFHRFADVAKRYAA